MLKDRRLTGPSSVKVYSSVEDAKLSQGHFQLIWAVSIVILFITILITTHEPPSRDPEPHTLSP